MLYLYESTKFISLRPLANCILVLCSSIAWKEASWVIVPSLSVSRHGWVTPLPVCLPPTILAVRSEEHTSELQSRGHLVCRLLLEKKNKATCNGQFGHLIF